MHFRFAHDGDVVEKDLERVGIQGDPEVALIKSAAATGPRLGVFASSFNPITTAHVELMKQAAEQFDLDEVLALAGKTNADKRVFECSLHERIAMLVLALERDPKASIGVSSHPYFVDMADALSRVYPDGTDLHFILGFDTFERVLDRDGRYFGRYYRKFDNRREALEYLTERSRLIVAGRGASGAQEYEELIDFEPAALRERTAYLDLAADVRKRSATDVRRRIAVGLPIRGLVPEPVERFIHERDLYKRNE